MTTQSDLQTALEAYKIATEQSEDLATQIKALQEKKKEFEAIALENEVKVHEFMRAQNETKLDLWNFKATISVRKVVNITDATLLPTQFVRIKTEPDKIAIAKAIKEGETVQGAEMVENESISIKF